MSSAVIAIVKGGLGNQLFIYATARALALRTDRTLHLDTTRGYTKDDYGRSYRLDRFPNLKTTPMPEEWRIAPTLKHPWHKIIRTLNKLLPRNQRSYFGEQRNSPPAQLTALQPGRERITLLGYWQNEAYFAAHAATIRAELTPPVPAGAQNRALGEKFVGCESVFLHFRRARYWNLLGRDYYQAAIDATRAKLSRPHFVLFGDDLEWPQQNLDFRGASVELVAHNSNDELADLWLMSRCRHAVVANSSFSWWGAWLGDPAADRFVFAPTQVGHPITMSDRWQRIVNTIEPEIKPAG
jgi:hypothetical protein